MEDKLFLNFFNFSFLINFFTFEWFFHSRVLEYFGVFFEFEFPGIKGCRGQAATRTKYSNPIPNPLPNSDTVMSQTPTFVLSCWEYGISITAGRALRSHEIKTASVYRCGPSPPLQRDYFYLFLREKLLCGCAALNAAAPHKK